MSKIRSSQLFCILVLCGAWSVICIPSMNESGQILGTIAGCLLQILFCLPMLALAKRQGSFEKLIQSQKWLGMLYIIFFLLWGAQSFIQLWEVSPPQLLPYSSKIAGGILIILTCLYTSSVGLKATARCAPFMIALFIISVIILILGAWKRIDISRIAFTRTGFWDSITIYNNLSCELMIAWVLLDRVKGRRNLAINSYLLTKAGFCILILFLSITVGGRLTELTGYPFFMLTTLSQPLQGQRADALYILVFVMLYIMHITIQTGIIGHLSEFLFPAFSKYTAPVSLLFMLLLAWLADSNIMQSITTISLPVLAFLVPLLLRMKQFSKSIHKEQSQHEAF
ncbi:MAG: hypothetical protein K2G88_00555 [Oscillospiraceae bacterium]|nr:hypothetical protein [Oscillospiraceae bacterium]MDE6657453.1 hypothetical protein [Oscillospiraceae bacterium]